PVMSCMSSSLYGGLHLYRPNAEEEPSAAELLEATKSLYVKTDVLKDTKIDACAPRIFHSPPHDPENAYTVSPRRPRVIAVRPGSSGATAFRPSANSAFRPIVKATAAAADDVIVVTDAAPPARPPKSTRIRQRARRLHQESICPISGQHRGSPPPLPMRAMDDTVLRIGQELARRKSAPVEELTRPVPAPRLSKLSSASTNSQPTPPPRPLPRRRTIQLDGVDDICKFVPDFLPSSISPRLLSPNSSSRHSPCNPSSLIRKRVPPSLVRPATPLPSHEGVTLAPSQIKERPTPSPQHIHHCKRTAQTLLSLPSGSLPLSSPTSTGKATSKDSGVQPSDEEEDYRKHSSSLSEEVAVIVEDDDDSIFTSITNQPRREEVVASEAPAPDALTTSLSRPLSVIEKHARVITWLKTSATVPPEEEAHHELTV
ncbi:hypothetical protein PFISCL1PPCAC_16758, partial [Pristionchus fissidentatus]